MVKKSTYLAVLFSFFLSSAFSQDATIAPACITPTASFQTITTCVGTKIELINSSTNITDNSTYEWNVWNDGTIDGTNKNISCTFGNAGTHTVKLTVTNPGGCSSTIIGSVHVKANPVASISEYSHVYIGYEPFSSTILNGNATGGDAALYTYAWSGSTATTKSIEVSPKVTTTYVLTVKDNSGCTGTTSATVKVTDVRCGAKMDKVAMCSPKGTSCVAQKLAPDYLNKGWTLGACSSTSTSASTTNSVNGSEAAERSELVETLHEEKSIRVLSNPTVGEFKLQLNNYNERTEVEIFNSNGTTVERRTINAGASALQNFNLTSKPSGIYLVKVVAGKEVKLARVLVSH